MERYFTIALVLGFVWGSECQIDTSNITVEQLLTRLQELEIAVKILQNSQNINSYTPTTTTAVPEVPLPLNVAGGLTLDQSGDEIGFHVTLVYDVTLDITDKIKFDRVVENIGGAYDSVTSEFICPKSGTYLLSLSIACQQGSYADVFVEINSTQRRNRYVLNTVCDHRKRTLSDGSALYCGQTQNGGSAIVTLNKGDRVSVKKLLPFKPKSTIVGREFSTFSGYLLRP